MANEMQHSTASEAASSDKSCSYSGTTDNSGVKNKTTAAVKRAVRCTDCSKKFDDWRLLQRHKRKACPKSSLRFSCRECNAFFSVRSELDSHISAAHVKKEHTSKNSNSSRNKVKSSSLSGSENCTTNKKSKLKELQKCRNKSEKLKIRKSALARQMAKRAGKLKTRMRDAKKSKNRNKCTVGSNPFPFTTSCAPDAQSFQFLCQSCLMCRFATYVELRQHEDWCARVPTSQGYVCLPCGRHYRNQGTLHRHGDEYHYAPFSLEVKKTLVNPFLFSTTIAQDAASHPHVCTSCQSVCFTTPALLRRHEDWCGQSTSAKDGFKCNKCCRYFRTGALLERHTDAAGCEKPDSIGTVSDSIKIVKDTEFKNLESDVQQKTAPNNYGVCPLCDVPYATQYEQQFHFLNVHNLTSSDLKIKQACERHIKRAFTGTVVTCLDCDQKVSSRLELVQHKRVCTKEKEAKRIILPAPSPVSKSTLVNNKSGSKNIAVKNRKPTKKVDTSKRTATTTVSSTLHKNTASSKNQHEGTMNKLSGSRALDSSGTQGLEISRSLLQNTAKVRKLSTGAEELMPKPNGELSVLGNGSQESFVTNGRITGVHNDAEPHSISTVNISKQEKPSSSATDAISYVTIDSDLLIESPVSLQSNEKTNGCSSVLKTDRHTSNKDSKPTTGSIELSSCEDKSGQTEQPVQTRTHEVNHNADQQHLKTVADHRSTEAKNASKSTAKVCNIAGKPSKLTRKRSWKNAVIDVVGPALRNCSTSACADEVKSGKKSSAKEEQPVVRNTRSRKSMDSAMQTIDVPASASRSENDAKVAHLESTSEGTSEVQQTLLEALQLSPKCHHRNLASALTTGYRTRSVVHEHATGSEDSGLAARSRAKHSNELSNSAVSSDRKELPLLASRNTKETVDTNKLEGTDRKRFSTRSVALTTHVGTSKQKLSCSEETL